MYTYRVEWQREGAHGYRLKPGLQHDLKAWCAKAKLENAAKELRTMKTSSLKAGVQH
jgi:hypothetical protein